MKSEVDRAQCADTPTCARSDCDARRATYQASQCIYLSKRRATEYVSLHRQPATLGVGKLKPSQADLFPQNTVLLEQVLGHGLLLSIQPAGQGDAHQLQWSRNGYHTERLSKSVDCGNWGTSAEYLRHTGILARVQCPQPREQFFEFERFRQIIIRTGIECPPFVRDRVLRRQYEHRRYRTLVAELSAYLETAQYWQTEIHDQDVKLFAARAFKTIAAIEGCFRPNTIAAQTPGHEVDDTWIIVNQQDSHDRFPTSTLSAWHHGQAAT